MLRFVLACFACASFLASSTVLCAQTPEIMSWGENLPGWSAKLKLTAVREGCSDTPTNCASYVTNLALKEGVSRVYVSMPLNVSTAASYAAQYSSLSLAYPKIVEVGFDDFVNDIENLQIAGKLSDPGTFLSSVITDAKSKNPNLTFGITTYADALSHGLVASSSWSNAGITYKSIPASVLGRIDYIHLYVHYREDASTYATAVATAKKIFPNAKIIAGAYPYDRIDFVPCAFKGTAHCTLAQEESFYQQLLEIQCDLVKNHTIAGLEFFFGYFGDPQDWPNWQETARICNSTRLSSCYANSTALQNMSVSVMQSAFSTPSTAAITLQYPSVYMGSEPVGKQGTPGKIWIKSSGSDALAISSIVVAGTNAADFPLTENCPASLAAGSICTLTVYFKPAAVGTRSGEIIVYDNASGASQRINLTGTGTGAASSAAVTLQYSFVFMGQEFVGKQGTPGKIWVKNSGDSTLSFSSITISGANPSEFPLVKSCGTSLAPATFCTLTVYFKPAALGTRTATIALHDNAGSGTQTITLTGTGIAP